MQFAQACAAAAPAHHRRRAHARHGLVDRSGPVHLTLLAESERGYANLCRLITLAHRRTRAWLPGATHARPRSSATALDRRSSTATPTA